MWSVSESLFAAHFCRSSIFMTSGRSLLWGAPLLILITQLPVFLQLTLTPDTVLYDLQAQCLTEGGVLYRDIVEPNLPGVVWVHTMVRSLAGTSAISLRIFDVIVVLGIAGLLGQLASSSPLDLPGRKTARLLIVSLLLLFYFSTSEWCHCQRDTWMLLPCLLALRLRISECHRAAANEIRPQNSSTQWISQLSCFVEGVLWATGFWLKPFVAVPAICVLLVSGLLLPSRKIWLRQVSVIVAGGILTGVLGILWMIKSGCWPYFVDMLTTWNGDYFQAGRSRWTFGRYIAHSQRLWPWILLHLPALVISVTSMGRALSHSRRPCDGNSSSHSEILLSACYVGWIFQAFAFQQLFDYIHVPGLMLALAVCIQWTSTQQLFNPSSSNQSLANDGRTGTLALPAAVAFFVLALFSSPTIQWNRQRHWFSCLQACADGVLAPEVKDDLAISPLPRWKELQPLIDKLRELHVTDMSLLAYNGNLIHLYPALDLHPATRYVYLDVLARCFPRRRSEMLAELERCNIEFVVSDLQEDGWEQDAVDESLLPVEISERSASLFFPYNQTPIFRSGGYVLFRISRPPGSLTSDYSPLERTVSLDITERSSEPKRQ